MPSLIKNMAALVVMQGVNYLFPLITLPYLTRALGVYQYGVLSTVLTFAAYVVLVVDFGFNLSATRDISQTARGNPQALQTIFANVMLSKLLLLVLTVAATLGILYSLPQYRPLIPAFCCMIPQFAGSVLFPVWFFQGIERVYFISILSILSKLLSLPLLFWLVRGPQDINQAALVSAAPMFISGVCGLLLALRQGVGLRAFRSARWRHVSQQLRSSSTVFMGTLAVTVYTACTPIILSLVSSYQQVGYFSAADKLRGAVLGIFLVLGQAIYPRANALVSSDPAAYWSFIRKLLLATLLLGWLAAVLFWSLMPRVAGPFLGSHFDHLDVLLKWMAPMMLLIPLAIVLSNCILLPMGLNRIFALVPVFTAAVHLSYSFYLSSVWGAAGASAAILITEVVSLGTLFIICWRQGFVRQLLNR